MIDFAYLHPQMTPEALGLLPEFFSDADPRPAAEQLDAAYAHGGGWNPMSGWTMGPGYDMSYPGDPVYRALAVAQLRDETILFYPYAWVAIVQADGSFEMARVD